MLKHATNILQGSEYPTASLVLPTLDALIRHMNPQYKLETRQRKAQQFSAAMRVAREKLFKDAVRRFQRMELHRLEDFVIAMMLDPRFANPGKSLKGLSAWQLVSQSGETQGALTDARCFEMLRLVYDGNYKATDPATPTSTSTGGTPSTKRQAAQHFASDDDSSDDDALGAATIDDELDKYHTVVNQLSSSAKKLLDPLEWWATNAANFPSVARMARNYLGCPASTGGLERMFSALGRNHDDFRKSTLEATMETRMQVRYNYK